MIETRHVGEVLVVTIQQTRLDAIIAPQLKVTLWDLVGEGAEQVIIDISAADFMDSSGLGVLISLLKLLGTEGDLKVVGAHGAVAQTFNITRMDRVFPMYDSVDAALAS